MKRPSFQFYPSDWAGNSNLRRCTHAEKGVWLDVMCLMHDQEEYGVLRWSLKEIAQAVGCSVAVLKGLITKGVLKGDEKELAEAFTYTPRSGRKDGETVTLVAVQAGPIWYSSRMVKDEYVRTIRGESSRFGDSPKPPKANTKASPKPPLGDGSSSSSSSSSSNLSPNLSHENAEDGDSGNAAASDDSPYGDPKPGAALCKTLRRLGVQVSPGNPDFTQWVTAGLTEDEAVAGVEIARSKKPAPQPIPWAYLAAVLTTQRNQPTGDIPEKPDDDQPWDGAI